MFLRRQPIESHSQQRPLFQLKRKLRLLVETPSQFTSLLRQIVMGDGQWLRRLQQLYRPSLDGGEAAPQNLMPPDDFIQALLQCSLVQLALQSHRSGDVISRIAWLQLIEKPKPFLRERQ